MSEPFFAITEDTILAGRVRLCQPATGYRAAIDPVLLAAAVDAPGDQPRGQALRVLDVGAGVGTISLCLAARLTTCCGALLEVQPDLAQLARDNLHRNGVEARFHVLCGDARVLIPALQHSFDIVVTNPPFHTPRDLDPSLSAARLAKDADEALLVAWLSKALIPLRHKGALYAILRADRLGEALVALKGQAGDITLLPLYSRAERPAKRVILRARKGSRGPLVLLPGLALHTLEGGYSPRIRAVLYGEASLPMRAC